MKKGNPKNVRPSRPGEVRNRHGVNNSANREIRKLTREQVAEIGSLLLKGTEADLEKYIASPGTPMIKKMLGNVLNRASNRGDHKAMMALIETIAGKAVQEVKVQVSTHAALVDMVNGSSDAPAEEVFEETAIFEDEDDDMGLTPEEDDND